MIARFDIFTGEPGCDPGGAMRDAGLWRIRSGRDIAQKGRSMGSHRWELKTDVAAHPQPVIRCQPSRCVLVQGRRFVGSCESFRCFRRGETARRDERVAVGDLQPRDSASLSDCGVDLSVSARSDSSACACAISGISGVGAKPSSASPRTAWASTGRPVDWRRLASACAASSSKVRAPCARAILTASSYAVSTAGDCRIEPQENIAAQFMEGRIAPGLAGLFR